MNNKILAIGSIIACIIILLASLSPVVGYNSARSSVKDSPLFSVRSKRAINEEIDSLTCQYIGKGKIFSFPSRSNQITFIQKVIESISIMDEQTFEKLKASVITQVLKDGSDENLHAIEINAVLNQLRKNPKIINNYIDEESNLDVTSSPYYTLCHWIPGCVPIWIIVIPLTFLLNVFVLLFVRIYFHITLKYNCIETLDIDCYP